MARKEAAEMPISIRGTFPAEVLEDFNLRLILLMYHDGKLALAESSSGDQVVWAPPYEPIRALETVIQTITRKLIFAFGWTIQNIRQESSIVLGTSNKQISEVAGEQERAFFVFLETNLCASRKTPLVWVPNQHEFCLSISAPAIRGATREALDAAQRREIIPAQFFT